LIILRERRDFSETFWSPLELSRRGSQARVEDPKIKVIIEWLGKQERRRRSREAIIPNIPNANDEVAILLCYYIIRFIIRFAAETSNIQQWPSKRSLFIIKGICRVCIAENVSAFD